MNSILMFLFRMWIMPAFGMAFAGDVSVLQGKIDIALSQFAVGYRNNAYIAEQLFPRVQVGEQRDLFWKFGRESQRISENDLRAPGAAAETISQTLSTTSYFCPDHSLARIISDEERANFQAGDINQSATQTLTNKILLAQEIRAAALATAPASYAGSNVLDVSGTIQWGAAANTKIVDQVMAAQLAVMASGQKPNLMIIGPAVWRALKSAPEIVARVTAKPGAKGVGANVTLEDLQTIFEVDTLLVPTAVSLEADMATADFVWGKHAIVAYVNPAAGFYDTSFGKTFVWTGAPGTAGGFSVEIARLTPASRKSDEVAVHSYYGQEVTSNISAYLLENAVA
jgi:hypothetical protein